MTLNLNQYLMKEQLVQIPGGLFVLETMYSLLFLIKENAHGLRTEKRLLKEHWVQMAGTAFVLETVYSLLQVVINAHGLRTEKRLLKEELLEDLHG